MQESHKSQSCVWIQAGVMMIVRAMVVVLHVFLFSLVPVVFSVPFLLSIERDPLKWGTLAYHPRDSDWPDSRELNELPEGH